VLERGDEGISAPSTAASSMFRTGQAGVWKQQLELTFALLCARTSESHLQVVGTAEPPPTRHQVLCKSEGKHGYKSKQFDYTGLCDVVCLITIKQEVNPGGERVV